MIWSALVRPVGVSGDDLAEFGAQVGVLDGAVGEGEDAVTGFLDRDLVVVDDDRGPGHPVGVDFPVVGAGWGTDRVDVLPGPEPAAVDDRGAGRGEGAHDVRRVEDLPGGVHGVHREALGGDVVPELLDRGRGPGPDHDPFDGQHTGQVGDVFAGQLPGPDESEDGTVGPGEVPGGDRAGGGGAVPGGDLPVDDREAFPGRGGVHHDHRPLRGQPPFPVARDVGHELDDGQVVAGRDGRHGKESGVRTGCVQGGDRWLDADPGGQVGVGLLDRVDDLLGVEQVIDVGRGQEQRHRGSFP